MVSYQDYYNGVMGRGGNSNAINQEMLRRMMDQNGGVIGPQYYLRGMQGDFGGHSLRPDGGGVGGGLPTYGQAPMPPRFIRTQVGMQAPNYGRPPMYQPNFNRPMYQNTSMQTPAQLPQYGAGMTRSNTSMQRPAQLPIYETGPNRFTPF